MKQWIVYNKIVDTFDKEIQNLSVFEGNHQWWIYLWTRHFDYLNDLSSSSNYGRLAPIYSEVELGPSCDKQVLKPFGKALSQVWQTAKK